MESKSGAANQPLRNTVPGRSRAPGTALPFPQALHGCPAGRSAPGRRPGYSGRTGRRRAGGRCRRRFSPPGGTLRTACADRRISVSFAAYHPVEAFVNLAFRERVQGGGGFVHDDEGSIFVDRPRDGHFLLFPAGEGNAFIGVFLSHPGMKPLRKPLQSFGQPGGRKGVRARSSSTFSLQATASPSGKAKIRKS